MSAWARDEETVLHAPPSICVSRMYGAWEPVTRQATWRAAPVPEKVFTSIELAELSMIEVACRNCLVICCIANCPSPRTSRRLRTTPVCLYVLNSTVMTAPTMRPITARVTMSSTRVRPSSSLDRDVIALGTQVPRVVDGDHVVLVVGLVQQDGVLTIGRAGVRAPGDELPRRRRRRAAPDLVAGEVAGQRRRGHPLQVRLLPLAFDLQSRWGSRGSGVQGDGVRAGLREVVPRVEEPHPDRLGPVPRRQGMQGGGRIGDRRPEVDPVGRELHLGRGRAGRGGGGQVEGHLGRGGIRGP